jgi:hypothetical protein
MRIWIQYPRIWNRHPGRWERFGANRLFNRTGPARDMRDGNNESLCSILPGAVVGSGIIEGPTEPC